MPLSHDHFEYAGFWRRLLAFILDTSMISAISTALAVAAFGWEYLGELQDDPIHSLSDWRMLRLQYGQPAVWTIGFWLWRMATPGKMLLDCEIVDARSYGRARPLQLVIRYFGYIASAIPLGLGFLWMLIDRRNQCWHDKLAGTLVVMQDASRQPLEVQP